MTARSTSTPAPAGARVAAVRPRATVLVCTSGRGEFLGDCLRSVASALGPEDELVVVEAVSHAAETAVEALGDGPWRVLHLDRPGKSRQLNAGILAARGEVVVVTDDDCRVSSGWVEGMAAPFTERDVGIAFGPVRGLSSVPGARGAAPRHRPGPAPAAVWAYSHGASLAVRAAAAHDVGGFDERLGPGAPVHGEEADLVLRLVSAGWRCWIADAPVVEHLEWRTAEQHLRNRLIYERGAGAWIGAAIRRSPGQGIRSLRLRLRYQAGVFRDPTTRGHAPPALAAFCSGLITGIRLAPRRFLTSSTSGDGSGPPKALRSLENRRVSARPRPAATKLRARIHAHQFWDETIDVASDVTTPGRLDQRHILPSLPWPAVNGRRCLVLGPGEGLMAFELERRGAAEVIFAGGRAEGPPPGFELIAELAGSEVKWRALTIADLDAATLGTFGVVIGDRVLGGVRDPIAVARTIRAVCDGFFLSIEPIDLWLSVLGRGSPLVRRGSRWDATTWVANGSAHRELLERGGFDVHSVSRPYVVRARDQHPRRSPLAWLRALPTLALTHDWSPGAPHRAILCGLPADRPADDHAAAADSETAGVSSGVGSRGRPRSAR